MRIVAARLSLLKAARPGLPVVVSDPQEAIVKSAEKMAKCVQSLRMIGGFGRGVKIRNARIANTWTRGRVTWFATRQAQLCVRDRGRFHRRRRAQPDRAGCGRRRYGR